MSSGRSFGVTQKPSKFFYYKQQIKFFLLKLFKRGNYAK